MRHPIINKINETPVSAIEALKTMYHGKVYAIVCNGRIDKFFKTRRGAEGYINKQSKVSYYDEYYMKMVTCGDGSEIVEIKETEIKKPVTDYRMWYMYLKDCLCYPHMTNIVVDNAERYGVDADLLEWIKENAKEIKETGGMKYIKEYEFDYEEVKEVTAAETETQEEAEEVKNVEEKENNDIVDITLNQAMNGIELRFQNKPNQSIIDDLKAHGFRWSGKQKMWYAKQSDERISYAESLNGLNGESVERQSNNNKVCQVESNSYPEINIDDLDNYVVSDELQNRLHNSSMFEVDWKTDCKNTFENIQAQAVEVLNKTDDKRLIYELKKYVQSYKKRYYELYIKMLNHKANNPSWAVTGRGGLNVRRYNKMQDRYDNMLRKHTELSNEFKKRLGQFQKRINELRAQKINNSINNVNELPVFETTRDNVTVAGYTDHNVRVYKCGCYTIAKSWGMFRIFKNGKEIETTLKTTSTLTDAKKYVGYLLQEDKAS